MAAILIKENVNGVALRIKSRHQLAMNLDYKKVSEAQTEGLKKFS